MKMPKTLLPPASMILIAIILLFLVGISFGQNKTDNRFKSFSFNHGKISIDLETSDTTYLINLVWDQLHKLQFEEITFIDYCGCAAPADTIITYRGEIYEVYCNSVKKMPNSILIDHSENRLRFINMWEAVRYYFKADDCEYACLDNKKKSVSEQKPVKWDKIATVDSAGNFVTPPYYSDQNSRLMRISNHLCSADYLDIFEEPDLVFNIKVESVDNFLIPVNKPIQIKVDTKLRSLFNEYVATYSKVNDNNGYLNYSLIQIKCFNYGLILPKR